MISVSTILVMECIDGTLKGRDIFSLGGAEKMKEVTVQNGTVLYMIIPFPFPQSTDSEGFDLFMSLAPAAKEH